MLPECVELARGKLVALDAVLLGEVGAHVFDERRATAGGSLIGFGALVGEMPEQVEVVLSNQVYIDRSELPPALVNRLIRLAAFQNPQFYSAQAMRLPTFGKPRVISCAELFTKHIALPRGCLEAALELFAFNGIRLNLRDQRRDGQSLGLHFLGTLTSEQQSAAEALMAHDTGVLAATTAFGKTIVAASLIVSLR